MFQKHCKKCGGCFDAREQRRRFCSLDCVWAFTRSQASPPDDAGRRWKRAAKMAHPHKERARDAVRRALRRGDIKRRPCAVCGSEKVEAHHADYSKPLDVQWLCPSHHRKADYELGVWRGGKAVVEIPEGGTS